MRTRLFKPALLVLFLSFLFVEVYAQPALRNRARHVLKRTNIVIFTAQRAVRTNKIYTGDLARAVAHQRYAKKLFVRNRLRRSVHHSRYARLLAFKALKANKEGVAKSWEFQASDNDLYSDAPSDAELDKVMEAEMKGTSFKDEDIVGANLEDIDISDTDAGEYKGRNN